MIGKHLLKIEHRAQRWATRFDDGAFPRPPRETLAHALRTTGWLRMPRVEGSLVEADDLIRVVTTDVPALVAEVRRLRAQNEDLRTQQRARRAECAAGSPEGGAE